MYIPALVWKMGHGWHGCFWADSKQWGSANVDGLEGSVYFPITVTNTMAAMAIHYAPTGADFRYINLVGLFNDGIKLKNSFGSTSYKWIAICQ